MRELKFDWIEALQDFAMVSGGIFDLQALWVGLNLTVLCYHLKLWHAWQLGLESGWELKVQYLPFDDHILICECLSARDVSYKIYDNQWNIV